MSIEVASCANQKSGKRKGRILLVQRGLGFHRQQPTSSHAMNELIILVYVVWHSFSLSVALVIKQLPVLFIDIYEG